MLVAVLGIGMLQSGAALADPVKETVNVGIEAGIGETEQADDIQEIYSQADYGSGPYKISLNGNRAFFVRRTSVYSHSNKPPKHSK